MMCGGDIPEHHFALEKQRRTVDMRSRTLENKHTGDHQGTPKTLEKASRQQQRSPGRCSFKCAKVVLMSVDMGEQDLRKQAHK